ncbi:hypothetical protein APS67_005306 [Streptomyces sp. AVP053U2]|nr:hypothetical protein APS67_005306 [Streptomyces sp. AVP053U2]
MSSGWAWESLTVSSVAGGCRPHTGSPGWGAPPHRVAGLLLGAMAMAGSDLPATALKVTDPSSWSASAWLSDIAPHLACGVTTVRAFDAVR